MIATPRMQLLGAEVSIEGAHVSHEITAKLAKWPSCRNPTEVRGFLGTVGVVRRWIQDFARIAKPLTALTKKMAPHEFKWTANAQEAMNTLKALASTAVPVRALDYEEARKVKPANQRRDDRGLVSVRVDASLIGVGWMIAQNLNGTEYPIVFGSITFNDVESRYSQPKLELYGVFRALKAERHRLHNIHFRLIVDASSLAKMLTNPDLPNAAMTRWIAYISLFTFEIKHAPGTSHRVPDGLSRRAKAAEDSDYSDDDVDLDEGIKLVKVPEIEINFAELKNEEYVGDGVHEMLNARMNRRFGEARVLETRWLAPRDLRYEKGICYVGEGEEAVERDLEEPKEHQHRVEDRDDERFWDELLAYLHLKRLPYPDSRAKQVQRQAKRFFLMENLLWRRNGDRPPLQVVLNPELRNRIMDDAHEGSGHRGRDPTFRKIRDSFWWPNMYMIVSAHCKSCHQCQMRSAYRDVVPLQPQYVRTILRRFDADSVHMPEGKGSFKYVIDLVDNLTGWVEAWALQKLKSEKVAEFLFDVMMRFGCVFQLTCNNGLEFFGATEILLDKYKVPVMRISAYNSHTNGKIKRTHQSYMDSIWKSHEGRTYDWPEKINYALWADCITIKRTTGYSPYYLLYGQHPLLPFDVTD